MVLTQYLINGRTSCNCNSGIRRPSSTSMSGSLETTDWLLQEERAFGGELTVSGGEAVYRVPETLYQEGSQRTKARSLTRFLSVQIGENVKGKPPVGMLGIQRETRALQRVHQCSWVSSCKPCASLNKGQGRRDSVLPAAQDSPQRRRTLAWSGALLVNLWNKRVLEITDVLWVY